VFYRYLLTLNFLKADYFVTGIVVAKMRILSYVYERHYTYQRYTVSADAVLHVCSS